MYAIFFNNIAWIFLFSGFLNITDSFSMHITQDAVLVTNITITGDTTVMKGLTTTLSATIEPADATDQTVNWSTSDDLTATVCCTGIHHLGKIKGNSGFTENY